MCWGCNQPFLCLFVSLDDLGFCPEELAYCARDRSQTFKSLHKHSFFKKPPPWGWLYFYFFGVRSHDMMWTATLASHMKFFPQRFGALFRARMLLLICGLIPCGFLCVRTSYLWHVASFITIVMPFKCPTFTPLDCIGGHNHTYNFLSNPHFVFVVPCLESHFSNFLGLSFWIHWISTLGS